MENIMKCPVLLAARVEFHRTKARNAPAHEMSLYTTEKNQRLNTFL